jgi:hypothetical protein
MALAAASAERVLPIFEMSLGPADRRPQAAIDLAWRAAGGEKIAQEEIAAALAAASAAMPEEGEAPFARLACVTAICGLKVLSGPVSEPLADPLVELMGTAAGAAEMFADDPEAGDEESNWQLCALAVAETHAGPVTRNLFAALGTTPGWLSTEE